MMMMVMTRQSWEEEVTTDDDDDDDDETILGGRSHRRCCHDPHVASPLQHRSSIFESLTMRIIIKEEDFLFRYTDDGEDYDDEDRHGGNSDEDDVASDEYVPARCCQLC